MNGLAARRTGPAASVPRELVFSPPGRALGGGGGVRRLSQAQTDGRHYEATGRQNVWAGHRKPSTLPWNLTIACCSRWPGSTSRAERTRHAPSKSPTRTQQPRIQPPSTGEGRKPRDISPPRRRAERAGSPSRACALSASSSREHQVWLSGSVFRVEVLCAELVGRRSPC